MSPDLGIEISFVVTRRAGDTVYTVTARHHLGGSLWTQSSNLFDGHIPQRAVNAMRNAVMSAIDGDLPSITEYREPSR